MINYSNTKFKNCPDCDSTNLHKKQVIYKTHKGKCVVCDRETDVITVEIDPYNFCELCIPCIEEYNITID
jgi:hypothetical protein